MNREFLKELGLEDETIEKVMVEHGKTVNKAKSDLDQVTTERDNLKETLSERDTQLEDLSKQAKDSKELQDTITKLQEDNKKKDTEHQETLAKERKLAKLELKLRDDLAKNPKAVKALIDVDKISLDGDNLIGYDEQVNPLKESDGYLFGKDVKPNSPTIVAPGNPNGGGGTTKSISEMSYQELADLKANNPAQFNELTKN